MLCSYSKGSKGNESDSSYSIYIPIVFSSGFQIKFDDHKHFGVIAGRYCTLVKHHNLCSLTVEGFRSEDECHAFLKEFKVATSWAILRRGVGIKIPDTVSSVDISNEPMLIDEERNWGHVLDSSGWTHVDGDYYAVQLVIIQESKRLVRAEMGKFGILQSSTPDTFLKDLEAGLSLTSNTNLINNKKLQVAVDIYSSYNFEVTVTGKFIKLVTTLEALLPEGQISGAPFSVLEQAKQAAKEYINELKNQDFYNLLGEAERQELNKETSRVLSRIGDVKYNSIGEKLELFLKEVLEANPDIGVFEELNPMLKQIYNARSNLLHNGVYCEDQLNEYLKLLSKLVPDILKSFFSS